jgi:hypothetical protein
MRHDDMKNAPDEKPTGKEPKPSRTEQAREVVEQYANDQREIIKIYARRRCSKPPQLACR